MGIILGIGSPTFWLPEQASTIAPEIDSLYYFVYYTSVLIFLGVVAAMIFFAYRYKRKSEDERPEPVHENKWLELSWIVIPTILVLLVFNWGFQSFINIKTAPPEAYEIHVRGMQWSWEFEYPNGATSGDLHVPVDRPVRLIMSSQDVIHSVGIPAFRVKHDVLPDRYTSLWFQATNVGEYTLFCTEYCGTEHATMDATVVVQSAGEFAEWLDDAAIDEDAPLAEIGQRRFEQSCQVCHTIDGTPDIGPTLQGLYMSERPQQDGTVRTADEDYIRESILEPSASITEGFDPVMPSFAHLSEREVSGLIEFIREQQ